MLSAATCTYVRACTQTCAYMLTKATTSTLRFWMQQNESCGNLTCTIQHAASNKYKAWGFNSLGSNGTQGSRAQTNAQHTTSRSCLKQKASERLHQVHTHCSPIPQLLLWHNFFSKLTNRLPMYHWFICCWVLGLFLHQIRRVVQTVSPKSFVLFLWYWKFLTGFPTIWSFGMSFRTSPIVSNILHMLGDTISAQVPCSQQLVVLTPYK